MQDINQLLNSLASKSGDPQAVEKLRSALQSGAGLQAAQAVTTQNADLLERAARAAQAGDMGQAARLAGELMRTREGAHLAQQLKDMFFHQ